MQQISYKIDVFEGPMDLLLHLIAKHKLNINDIPIVELVNQYVDYVRQMQEQDFDVAGEFLEMAARLIYIKTVSLLPRHEEAEQLKKELTGELIEYRDCKLMAEKLSEIEDISTEQIKDCFANINNFAKYAFKRTVFDSEFGDDYRGEFQRLLSEARLVKRRRVI